MRSSQIHHTIATAEQEFGLDPTLFTQGPVDNNALSCYSPDIWYRAIKRAGDFLRKAAYARSFATLPLPPDVFGERPTFAQDTLRTIVNASIQPKPHHAPQELSFIYHRAPTVGACSDAEAYFGHALQTMQSKNDIPFWDSWCEKVGWTLIATGNTAAGLVKAEGEESFLSFDAIRIGGIPFPAGSLFGISLQDDYLPQAGERSHTTVDHIKGLLFRRVTAFALPPDERHTIFTRVGHNEPLDDWGLEKIRAVAQDALRFSSQIVI